MWIFLPVLQELWSYTSYKSFRIYFYFIIFKFLYTVNNLKFYSLHLFLQSLSIFTSTRPEKILLFSQHSHIFKFPHSLSIISRLTNLFILCSVYLISLWSWVLHHLVFNLWAIFDYNSILYRLHANIAQLQRNWTVVQLIEKRFRTIYELLLLLLLLLLWSWRPAAPLCVTRTRYQCLLST